MKIAGSIKPGIRGEAGGINDKCVAVPMADRVAHVCVGGIRSDVVEMDGPLSICEFEDHHDLVCPLNDLERVRQIHRERDARHVAFELRITIQPVLSVLALSLSRPGLIRNLVALDDSHTRWDPAHRSERHDRGRQHRNIGINAWLRHHRTRCVGLQVPIRRRVGLPYPAEVGLAVRGAGLSSRRCHSE